MINRREQYDWMTVQNILSDIEYLRIDESDESYGVTSDRQRELVKYDKIFELLKGVQKKSTDCGTI
tara:strand:+ start:1445 stop:1642 length:198 start_codon:yes stop_codon:yes gene_type:complete